MRLHCFSTYVALGDFVKAGGWGSFPSSRKIFEKKNG